MDVATKMFIDGRVCLLKMNPVNDWVGPFLERALAPLISRNYLRIVYGGVEVGTYLVNLSQVDELHLTGSAQTHDMIVWGAPGDERKRRLAAGDPLLKTPITSELGNVSPVAIVPSDYSDSELRFMSRNIVTMVVSNASFNCNAAKMIVTATGWPQRARLLDLIGSTLADASTRRAYYPGAPERWQALLAKHDDAERFGDASGGKLPWVLIRGLDSGDPDEPLFSIEPFCGIISETSVGSTDAVEFLEAATAFMNHRLWGTLNAMILISPKLEADPLVSAALDRAIVDLRYGTVAINHWPALGYGFGCMSWGGHQSSTLDNIQSGLGWVHNTFMLDGIDKSVIRGPLTVKPYPAVLRQREDHQRGTAFTANGSETQLAQAAWALETCAVVVGALRFQFTYRSTTTFITSIVRLGFSLISCQKSSLSMRRATTSVSARQSALRGVSVRTARSPMTSVDSATNTWPSRRISP